MRESNAKLESTSVSEVQRKKLASSVVKNSVSIGSKRIAWVPVELLNIQPYQRGRQRHVEQIAENWNESKCNVLLVSYDEKNGYFNVVDGQHRAAAAKMRKVEYLVCEIFSDMSISSEAAMFVDANITTKKLNPFDTYKANQFIKAEDETELSILDKRIAEVCKAYNVKVAKTNSAGTLKSVPVARRIMKHEEGEEAIKWVFEVIQDSYWNMFKDGYNSDLMSVLSKIFFMRRTDTEVIKSRLCGFFIKSTPAELEALGNNTYPNLTRIGRLEAILADIIKDPEDTAPIQKKSVKRALNIA